MDPDFIESIAKFEPKIPALIVNQSYGGCGLVALSDVALQVNGIVFVKAGKIGHLLGPSDGCFRRRRGALPGQPVGL